MDTMAKRFPPIKLTKSTYALAIQWDCVGDRGVDLDLQALIVDDNGLVVDAAYYNNVSACGGAVTLSGDEQTGNAEGYDESMWLMMKKMPANVKLVMFIIAVYGKGHLKDVANGQLAFLEEGNPVKFFKVENSRGDCDLVAMLRRCPKGGWELQQVEQPAEYGSHFLDILEPTIGDVIRAEIPDAPKCLKVSFEMTKGHACPLPDNSAVKRVFVGVGGALIPGQKAAVDIDISAVFVSKDHKIIGAVDCDHSELHGVAHSGDEKAGAERGCGDDEAISVDLARVPEHVQAIVLVMNVANGTFGQLRRAYVRIIDQLGKELVRYDIREGEVRSMNGLVVAKLIRAQGRRWDFVAIGNFYTASGSSWKAASNLIERCVQDRAEAQQAADEITAAPQPLPETPVGAAAAESEQPASLAASEGQPDSELMASAGDRAESKGHKFRKCLSKGASMLFVSNPEAKPTGMKATTTFPSSQGQFSTMSRQPSNVTAVSRLSRCSFASMQSEAGASERLGTSTMIRKGTIRLSMQEIGDEDLVALAGDEEEEGTSRACAPCSSSRGGFFSFCAPAPPAKVP